MKRIATNLALVLLIVACLVGAFRSKASADSLQEIEPYQFASFQGGSVKIFKAVHEGCELYITTGTVYSGNPTVAITTGRGCK